jgi:imidazolonepropionase-like amidohydrolase
MNAWIILLVLLAQAPAPIVIRGATIVDGNGAAPIENGVIVIEGEKIAAVGKAGAVTAPPGATVVDAAGKWVIPGLIDAHVHFFQSGGLYTRPDAIDLRAVRPYAEELAWIERRLPSTYARYLACGVTSVVDVGGPMWNFKVREQANGLLRAPRVAVAGPLVSTYSPPALASPDPAIIKVNDEDEARALVARLLEHEPDLVKIWFIFRQGDKLADLRPIVRATIESSHEAGVRVAVHATQLEVARAAVEEGADVLVHSVDDKPVDEAFIALLREHHTVYTTTLVVQEGYQEVLGQCVSLNDIEERLGDPEVMATWQDLPLVQKGAQPRKRQGTSPVALGNLKKLQDAGIIIAAGTDAGNIGTLHGPSLHREFELMAEAGLTPMQILVAATKGSAQVMGRLSDLGTIEKGKLADLVVLGADPTARIENARRIERVFKGGQMLDPDDLVPPKPQAIVDLQIDAYNRRDLDAFLRCYADDVVGVLMPSGTFMFRDRDVWRDSHRQVFAENPELHCTIASRVVDGRFVVDQEVISGMKAAPPLRRAAMYEVEGRQIKRVWFFDQ